MPGIVQQSHSSTGIVYLTGLARETGNVRLAALDLRRSQEADLGDLKPESVTSENPPFHLNR